ncbi:MAG: UvrD-helicase domain-containing protein [Gemmatimonadaceae bacterium]|nr:UvrD-helicase domain-containing protein [Gemmatimonadaceae bacterium]
MSDAVGASVMEPFNALEVPLAPGVTLVEASAGTGKTFAITRLVLRLLLERRVESLSRILVVTFTEKATQELVTRIRSVLRLAEQVWSDTPPPLSDTTADLFALRATHGPAGRQVVQDALAALDDLAVSTIHGFCQRILSESALESRIPFRTTFIEDDTEPFSRAARDWARRRVMLNDEAAGMVVAEGGNVDAWVKKVVSPYRRQPQTRVEHDPTDEAQALVADFVTSVDGAFELEKVRRHLLGFDDLLRKLSDALVGEGPEGPLARRIRTRFGAALIDEFQDTDQTQFPIFSNAFAGCPLFLIGDPKQSIYRFRGADIHAYLRAATAARRKYTLFQNFRSTAGYVLAVEQLFTRASDPFLVSEQDIPYPRVSAALAPPPPGGVATDGRGAMEWWWVDGSLGKKKTVSKDDAIRLVVRDVTNEIVRLQAGGVAYGSIAVLTRTNDEARLVKASLDRARVPAVIGGDADVLESEEAQELSRLAAAIAVPHDSRAVRSAMATRLWGSDAAEIAHTLDTNGAHEAAWAAIAERFVRARELWRTRGVAAAFGELLAERRTAARLLALPDGERRLTNVRHVTELFHEGWATEGIAPEGFSAWVARERTVVNTPGRRELRLETDSDAVQVLTVHKAKGLQFDIVFCPMLWQSRGPDEGPLGVPVALVSDGATAVLDLGTSRIGERQSTARLEDRAENLRLAYVALTRAIHRCYVVWGEIGQKGAGDSALGHLLRTPDGTVSRETLADLVAQSGGVMTVRDVVADAPRAVAPAPGGVTAKAAPRALRLAAGQLESWRMTSFSGLIMEAHSDEGRDVADPLMLPERAEEPMPATGFRAFPAGRQAGIALHDIFEALDFRRAGDDRTRDLVRRTLGRYGLVDDASLAEGRVDDVVAMLETTCRAPIPGAGFTLAQVPLRATLREWRFDLSVATPSARRIADALAAHGSPHARAYAPLVRALRDSVVGGYLNGVVDLAFEHEGQWWLMDWKSNQLGAADDDYAPPALDAAMRAAHYTLQYHLYLVALHRHLLLRQPGYDPAAHWGGVAYVFLRGVAGVGEHGWFRDRPTPALLDALDVALGRRR